MKTTKRILAFMFAVAMIAVMAVSVNAAAPAPEGKITVTNPVKNEVYTLYKIFDVPYYTTTGTGEDAVLDKVAYIFSPNVYADGDFFIALTADNSPFNCEQSGDDYSISLKDGKDEKDIEKFIKDNLTHVTAKESKTATDPATPIEYTGLEYGYYFVTTTVGSFAMIDTAAKEVEIAEKNTMPTVEKKIKEDSTDSWGDSADYSIEDAIPYKATVNIGKGNDKDITLTDTLENQIFNQDSVAIDGWTKGTDYTVSFNENNNVMTVVLKTAKIKTLTANSDIVITYSAKFDKTKTNLTNAVGNDNTIVLTYSHLTTQDSTKVKTYQFDLVKTDEDNKLLTGAQFTLWDAKENGNQIALIYDLELDAYRPVASGEEAGNIKMISSGKIKVYGLDADTYYLQEDVAPAGFNKLTERSKVSLTADNNATVTNETWESGGVQIINKTGSELPSTGGKGKMLFILIGAVVVAASGIFIVTNKRMSKEDI